MPPVSVLIKPVSGSCDMACAYCFYADEAGCRETANFGRMSGETLRELVRRVYAYADSDVSFAFQGGEPTLAGTAFFAAFLEHVRTYNTRCIPTSFAVQTNGLNLPEDMLRLFARESFLVGVSLDGPRDIHDRFRRDRDGRGTYDRVTRAIRSLRQAGCAVNILSVITDSSASRGREIYRANREYGYLQFLPCLPPLSGDAGPCSLSPASYAAFLRDTFDEYARDALRGQFVSVRHFDNFVAAAAGRTMEDCAMRGECGLYYLVEADGSVYPCDFYALDEYRMGSIAETPLNRLARSPALRCFLREADTPPPECAGCPWISFCRGGCRREREVSGDGRIGRSIWCNAYREFFPAAHPRLKLLAEKMFGGSVCQ